MFTLKRFTDHDVQGTFGELWYDDQFLCYTVEQPWNNNKPFKSCVPAGRYNLKPFDSPRFGQTYALHNPYINVTLYPDDTPGNRYACLFHAANWASDVQGCIGPGANLSCGRGNWMVTSSQRTLKQVLNLMDSLPEDKLILDTVWDCGER